MGALDDILDYGRQWVDSEYQKGMERNKQLSPRTVLGEMIAGAMNLIPAGRMGARSHGAPVRMIDDVLVGRGNEPVKQFGVEQDGSRGRLSVTHDGVVRNSFLNPKLRGQGLGRSMYEEAVNYFGEQGKPLQSDVGISADAARIYESLARNGYDVTRSPSARRADGGGWIAGDQPVFTVRSRPMNPLGAILGLNDQ